MLNILPKKKPTTYFPQGTEGRAVRSWLKGVGEERVGWPARMTRFQWDEPRWRWWGQYGIECQSTLNSFLEPRQRWWGQYGIECKSTLNSFLERRRRLLGQYDIEYQVH